MTANTTVPPQDRTQLRLRVVRAMQSNVLAVPAQGVFALLTSGIIARHLGVELFAHYAVFTALRSSLLFSTDLGAAAASSKFYSEAAEREGYRGVLRVLRHQSVVGAASAAVVIGIVLASAPLAERLFSIRPEYGFLFAYAAAVLVADEVARIAQTFLWARFAHASVNKIGVASAVLQPILMLSVVALDGSLRGVLVATAVVSAFKALVMGWAAWREMDALRRVPLEVDRREAPGISFTRFAKVSSVTWLEKSVSYFYGTSFLTLMLATSLSKASLAQFALASDVTTRALSLVLSPTIGLLMPAFATVYARGDRAANNDVFTLAIRGLALLLAPAAVGVVGLAPWLVYTLFSSSYAPAVPLIQALTLLSFAEYAVYGPANASLIASERVRAFALVKVGGLVALPVFLLAVPHLSLLIVAVAYGGLRLVTAVGLLAAAALADRFSVPGRFFVSIGAATGCALVAVFAVLRAVPDVTLGSALAAASGIAALTVGCIWLGCVQARDVRLLRDLGLPDGRWYRMIVGLVGSERR